MKITLNINPLSKKAEQEISRLKKGEVSSFIRDAIEFYVTYKEQINNFELSVKLDYALNKLELIENIINSKSITDINNDFQRTDNSKKYEKDAQETLIESLSNFL
ncbi:MAG: hypothetical protein N2448_06395 [Caloramator sp.]|nr:hypothetical protein [Caloramator sp.]